MGKVFTLEFIPEDRDGNEKPALGFADFAVRCQSAAGDDAVHMDMVIQFLIPGVENLNDSGNSAKIFFIGGKLQECFGTAFVEEAVKELLVAKEEAVEIMRKCKDHMEIGGIYHFRPSFIDPELFFNSLTVRTAAVAAGVIVDLCMSAVLTNAEIAAESFGFTTDERMGRFFLDITRNLPCLTERVIGTPEDILYWEGGGGRGIGIRSR